MYSKYRPSLYSTYCLVFLLIYELKHFMHLPAILFKIYFNSRMNNNYRDDHKVLKWNLMTDETSEVSIAMYAYITYN